MKYLLGILTVCALLVGGLLINMTTSSEVEGKGHVPLNKVQVCHDADGEGGEVITVSKNALNAHQQHGDCQLPACDFNNVFFTGDSCTATDSGDGTCVVANARDDAGGLTPACPAGTF